AVTRTGAQTGRAQTGTKLGAGARRKGTPPVTLSEMLSVSRISSPSTPGRSRLLAARARGRPTTARVRCIARLHQRPADRSTMKPGAGFVSLEPTNPEPTSSVTERQNY